MKRIELSPEYHRAHNFFRRLHVATWSEAVWAIPTGNGTYSGKIGAINPDAYGLLGLRETKDGDPWEFEFIEDTHRYTHVQDTSLVIKVNGVVIGAHQPTHDQGIYWTFARRPGRGDERSNPWGMLLCWAHGDGLFVLTFDRIFEHSEKQVRTRRYWSEREQSRGLMNAIQHMESSKSGEIGADLGQREATAK